MATLHDYEQQFRHCCWMTPWTFKDAGHNVRIAYGSIQLLEWVEHQTTACALEQDLKYA